MQKPEPNNKQIENLQVKLIKLQKKHENQKENLFKARRLKKLRQRNKKLYRKVKSYQVDKVRLSRKEN